MQAIALAHIGGKELEHFGHGKGKTVSTKRCWICGLVTCPLTPKAPSQKEQLSLLCPMACVLTLGAPVCSADNS